MNSNESSISTGRPCVPEDGDIALMAKGTVSCPKTYSRNWTKPSGAGSTPVLDPVTQRENRGQSSNQVQVETSQQTKTAKTKKAENIRNERDKLWAKVKITQGIKLATLNIKGKNYANGKSKYKNLTSILRKNRIAILAVQETRLNDEEVEKLHRENPKIIIESNNDDTSKEGVGFVINKDILVNKTWKHTSLIQGRASRLEIDWTEDNGLDIIVSYAPNATTDKVEYFEKLLDTIKNIDDWREPILMGDFNFVEEAIDRQPQHPDDNRITNAFRKIKQKLKLIDGWRMHNPHEIKHTFMQESSKSLSRIDRIYMTKEVYRYSYAWDVESSGSISDHDIATVEILKKHLPYIGKGVWKLADKILEYQPFRKQVKKLLKNAENEIRKYVRDEHITPDLNEKRKKSNPQKIWLETKTKIRDIAKDEAKNKKIRLREEMEFLESNIEEQIEKLNDTMLGENERKLIHDELIKNKIKRNKMEDERISKLQLKTRARYELEGEKNTKYWFSLKKEKMERQTIYGLQDKNRRIITETKEMIKIASEYHQDLQKRPIHNEEREEAIQEMENLVDKKLTQDQIDMFEEFTSEDDIEDALRNTKNGKSPGTDGLTYEFYKSWPRPQNDEEAKENPDIIKILAMVIRDVEKHGVHDKAFIRGVMSLMYKKKDKTRIENYRPLTLINTDYKIQTKTIAKKLGKVVKDLIHENQAGFIPGRGLYDHTRLSHMIIEYCELKNVNGCIIALDQEKAYDKIDHDYMWRILAKNGFPKNFINRVKSLYSKAETSVMINGVRPKPIKIERGVRQGDPMSCILYDLAIEPLAQAIRKSKLQGIKIPGSKDRLIVTLFADDTLVYIQENDNLKILETIIDKFCKASTAKFNMEKTEYLPIGNKTYRKNVIETRQIGTNEKLQENLKIIPDGTAMRTLGAWVGNETKTYPQWQKILEKQKEIMDKWSEANLSFRGKELILKALVQSRALFLATVNGMPKDIQETMTKEMKNFLWNNRKGLMCWDEIIAERELGGLGIPDIIARTEAIQVIWLKKWLAPRKKRKLWAKITDEILKANVPSKPMVKEQNIISWISQNWNESMAKDAKISPAIREMLKVGRKYNVAINGPKISHQVKIKMPIWHHFAAKDNYTWNKKAALCLSTKHHIKTVKDLSDYIETLQAPNDCNHSENCRKIAETLMNKIPEKYNPTNMTPHKDNLDHTPRRRARNSSKDITKTSITFNPDITERKSIENAIRIFGEKNTYKKRRQKIKEPTTKPAYRKEKKVDKNQITLYTDGSCDKNGCENARTGAGIWHAENSKRNKAIRLHNGTQTNQRAELMAIIIAMKYNSKNRKIKIKSDSKTTIEGIVQKLQSWEDRDWLNVTNAEEWKYLAQLLRKRRAKTKFKWVKAHDGKEGNEKADQLAKEGVKNEEIMEIDMTRDEKFEIHGARLQTLTQAQAYRLIVRKKRNIPGGKSSITSDNLENIQDEIERTTEMRPTTEKIWKSVTKGNINMKISDFIWKLTHNRLKCGKYFRHIENLKDREFCTCGETETPAHILLFCKDSEVEKTWREIGKIWNTSSKTKWIPPSLGIIAGIGAMTLKNSEGKYCKQTTERYKTIISQTTWMIWKARNRKIFDEKPTDFEKSMKLWKELISERILTEYTQIEMIDYKKRKLVYKNFETRWCENKIMAELTEDNKLKINII